MRGQLSLAAVALAVWLALVPCAAAAVPHGFVGVLADGPLVQDPGLLAQQTPAMKRAGVETVRIVFPWADDEPLGSPLDGNPTDFTATDAIVRPLAEAGLAVLPVVQVVPDWAAWAPGPFSDPFRYGSPPRDPADYARFLTALIGRYGPQGTLWNELPAAARHPIRRWQIWNEPMIPKYWTRQPWPANYRTLIERGADAIHAADPGAKVVAAGLPNLGPRKGAWQFARKLYAWTTRSSFDEVAVHPFAAGPENVLKTLQKVRAVMRAHGDGRKPILVSEIAYSSRASVVPAPKTLGPLDDTRRGQGQKIAATLRALAAARTRLGLSGVVYATWASSHADPSLWPDFIGLNRVHAGAVRPKPALKAFARVAQRLESGR